ncbi:NUDIX hydrolase [Lutibacter sp.]|uniref:NUDIX hydrolase n=1 Tax=Lutibacter sp. TaxID=1925666 RepID=UPI00356156C7
MTENKNISTSLNKVAFETVDIFGIIKKLLDGDSDGICLLCSDLEGCWQLFKSQFKIQKAAGGKVLNFKNEVLFIYRFNKWDLPKGKLEKGESIEECAVREVEEECGITNLSIENELDTTFHIFERNNTVILKITYWFLMKTTYNEKLTPQLEEGIEQVVFKNKIETEDALKNTYENIKLLFL